MADIDQVKKGPSKTLLWTAFLTTFGSSSLIGYNLAVVNNPKIHVVNFLNATMDNPSDNMLEMYYALVTSIYVVAGAIGAFGCGIIADFFGRRNGLIMNHMLQIIGGIMCGACKAAASPALLYIGRVFCGLNSGFIIGLASLYLTEIAPRKLRGIFGGGHQLAVTCGILLAYVLTLSSVLNTADLWPLALAIGIIPAVISLIFLPFCPKSPRWLFMSKNDEEASRKAFLRFNKLENVDDFIAELKAEREAMKDTPKFKFLQLFTRKDLRIAVAIACIIQVMQQLSGINAVISYSSTMMTTAGVPPEKNEICVVGVGVVNVIMTIVSLFVIERAGRRSLILWPSIVVILSLIFLTIFVNLASSVPKAQKSTMGSISVVFIFTYIIAFAVGLGPIPGLLVSEIFRQEPRASAYSLSQGLQWTSNLIVLLSYPNMNKAIQGYSFLPFFGILVVCWVFLFLFMPETSKRTFDEIATELAFGNIVVGRKTTRLSTSKAQADKNVSNVQDADAENRLLGEKQPVTNIDL